MPTIHPSAVIDPSAQIADDVEIGPGCVVEGRVTVGAGCRLIGQVYLAGPAVLGSGNTLYPFSAVGLAPQDAKFTGPTAGVRIGDGNVFRESATVHAASQAEHPTRLGDGNLLMTCTHVAHDATVGSRCVLASGALLGGHAHVEDDVIVGGNAAVHQFCRLGRLSLLGGLSAAPRDVPPFCIASRSSRVTGLNTIGLRRAGVPGAAVNALGEAVKILYVHGHARPKAVELIRAAADELGTPAADLLLEFAAFVAGSQRGLAPHVRSRSR